MTDNLVRCEKAGDADCPISREELSTAPCHHARAHAVFFYQYQEHGCDHNDIKWCGLKTRCIPVEDSDD